MLSDLLAFAQFSIYLSFSCLRAVQFSVIIIITAFYWGGNNSVVWAVVQTRSLFHTAQLATLIYLKLQELLLFLQELVMCWHS